MNLRCVLEADPIRRWRVLRAALAAMAGAVALVLAATPAQARDDDDDDPEPRDRGFCSATAKLMYSACGFESKDDFYVAKAKCINLANAGERTQCLRDAGQARSDAGKACRERLDWRRAACTVLGEGRYVPAFGPDRFDSNFRQLSNPNPYFPLGIGYRWEYRGGTERVTHEVTSDTKLVEGVTCIVLRDLVYEQDRLKEATDDWFAAGRDGSTWYCGEEVKDYDSFDGDRPRLPELISISGSFKHGRNGDKAGIIMPAQPRVGQVYLEEFSLGNAEDVSEVLSVNYAFGANRELDKLVPRDLALRMCNRDCVVTKNFSLMEPGIYALKYYARGIGFFLETKPLDGKTLQIVSCNFDPRCVALPAP
jgi:hypothetical protein